MSVLLLEKINFNFQKSTGSKMASGLSVCTKMISSSVDGVSRAEIANLDGIDLAMRSYKPKKVLLQGIWLTPQIARHLKETYKNTDFYIHVHSNIPFLAMEPSSFYQFREALELGFGLVFNDQRAADCFKGAVFLPNIYHVEERYKMKSKSSDVLNVVCAGSVRPMKNHCTQALAAIMYANNIGKKLVFYYQSGRSEGGDGIKMAMEGIFSMHKQHELRVLPWMPHSSFLEFLTGMDFGLQVSMSETFNIVAADYAHVGLPMVVSSEVEWASPKSKVTNCGNAVMIANAMTFAAGEVKTNKHFIQSSSAKAKARWESFVKA